MHKIIIYLLTVLLLLMIQFGCSNSSNDSSNDSSSVTLPTVIPTEVHDITLDGPFILTISGQISGHSIEGVIVPNEEVNLTTYELHDNNVTLEVTTRNSSSFATLTAISLEDQWITFIAPPSIAEGELSLVKGGKTITSRSYKLYDREGIYLTSLSPTHAKAGEVITLNGLRLQQATHLSSLHGEFNLSITPTDPYHFSFTLPSGVHSDEIYLSSETTVSNPLPLTVMQDVDVTVNVTNGVILDHSTIGFIANGDIHLVDASDHTKLPLENRPSYIQATYQKAGEYHHLYTALILPDRTESLIVDANSTAVAFIFMALGDVVLSTADAVTLYDHIAANSKVQLFAETIADVQKKDLESWDTLSDPNLKSTFQAALTDIIATQQSLSHTLSSRHKATDLSPSLASATVIDNAVLKITQEPESDLIYVNDIDYGYLYNSSLRNGKVTVVNDTMLYLSVEAIGKDPADCALAEEYGEGCIINHYHHIRDPFDMQYRSVVPPKSGLLGISVAQNFDLDGRDAHLEIITGGMEGESDKENIAKVLKFHSFIKGIVMPYLNVALSPILGNAMPDDPSTVKRIVEGLSKVYTKDAWVIISQILLNDKSNWGDAVTKLILKPIGQGIGSCVSTEPGPLCYAALKGIAKFYGYNSDDLYKELQQRLITVAYEEVASRAIVMIPVAGWVLEAAIIVYDNYDTVKDLKTIGATIHDIGATPQEINADVDFKLAINHVTPTCIGVSSTDTEQSIYIKGEGFIISSGEKPTISIINEGGLKRDATHTDVPSNDKIYALFDAQRLIDNRSVLSHLYVTHDPDYFIMYDKELRIIDEGDAVVHFDTIEPDQAIPRAEVTLKGCGWLPLDDIKVFFESISGEDVTAEILSKSVEEIVVKVPDNAVDGNVYVTSGVKHTASIYFDVSEFGLISADDDILISNEDLLLNGKGLDRVKFIVFIDSANNRQKLTYNPVSPSAETLLISVPSGLASGPVKIYVIRDDDLESNTLTLKRLPDSVIVSPESQGFTTPLTITLTQPEQLAIYYQLQGDVAIRYDGPFTITPEALGNANKWLLTVYAEVIFNGISYQSPHTTYSYTPVLSDCPYIQDTSLHGYHYANKSWLNAKDTDGDGYFDDYLLCSYYDSKHLGSEYPYVDNLYDGFAREFYENGYKKFEGAYIKGKAEGEHTHYYSDGITISTQKNYTDGKLDGTAITKYENGVISSHFEYVNGYIEGLAISNYESDQRRGETEYVHSQREGTSIKYYDNIIHSLQYIKHYVADYLEGLEQEFYDNEKTRIEGNWKTLHSSNYTKSVQDGIWIQYYITGKRSTLVTYKALVQNDHILSRRDGDYINYYDDPNKEQIEYKSIYILGKREGETQGYYLSGDTRYTGQYLNDLRTGEWREWREDRTLSKVTNYKEDLKDGLEIFYENDGIHYSRTTEYRANRINGEQIFYYSGTNDFYTLTTYVDNVKEGPYYFYYSSGNINISGYYVDGLKDGQFKTYSTDGTMTKCEIYAAGLLTGSCMP